MSQPLDEKAGTPQRHYDVVVVGSGAAGLTAAVRAAADGARVAVFEKAAKLGGTTSWSGGMLWIPNNPRMAELGITDSTDEALEYMSSLAQGTLDEDLARTMYDRGPEAITWLEENTAVEFRVVQQFPDYHPELPGAKLEGGRVIESSMFEYTKLGAWADRMDNGRQLPAHMTFSETAQAKARPLPSPEEFERRRLTDRRGFGQGLLGSLLSAALNSGVELFTSARVTALQSDEEGGITGVAVEIGGSLLEVRSAAVVLATGGFEWDSELTKTFLRGPLDRAASVPTNTGDGLRLAMRAGAALTNMTQAHWVPQVDVQFADGDRTSWQANSLRCLPHSIMVNSRGQRFVNEASTYNALCSAFHAVDPATYEYVNRTAWTVFDHYYATKYGLFSFLTADTGTPDWITSAPTIASLAERLGIPADALQASVERWNVQAANGKDDDYCRGESANDIWWGDPALRGSREAVLGPVDTGPYYAIQIYCGTLGTKGGPRTDGHARVLDGGGRPIPGLYAAGNVMGSPTGSANGGGGGTLGPAVVFGYLAGEHALTLLPVSATPAAL